MIIKSNFAERRKHHRFKVETGLWAGFKKTFAFKLGYRTVNLSPIVDLSIGGLCFHYISKEMWTPKFHELSITKTPDKIKIKNILFHPVSDFSISNLGPSRFLRRCGIQFEELTELQTYQLHYFIQNQRTDDYPVDRRIAKDRRQSSAAGRVDVDRRQTKERRKRRIPL